MSGVRRVIAGQPTLIAVAIRVSLLAGLAFGLRLDGEQVAAVVLAVEAWLAVFQYALVTPESRVAARIDAATNLAVAETKIAVEEGVRSLAAASVVEGNAVEAALVVEDPRPGPDRPLRGRPRPRVGPP